MARLRSVDALRGATIAAMVLINEPAVGPPYLYRQLTHAAWDGWTFADVVFPMFLFLAGVSMAWSFAASRPPWSRMVRRAALLVALGIVLNAAPTVFAGGDVVGTVRIPGVLQRIGIAWFAAAVAVILLPVRRQVVLAAGLLLGYWAVISWVPVPGRGTGLTPAVNLPGWIDRAVFGATHIYAAGTRGHDPEGMLSTVPAIAGVLAGYWAGRVLRTGENVWRLAAAGVVAVVAGLAWSTVLPINKRMWTPSFVVLMAGIGLVALCLSYWCFDGDRALPSLPLRVLGANALVAYVGSELVGAYTGSFTHLVPGIGEAPWTYWVWWRWLEPVFGGRGGNLAFAAVVLAVWWAVAAVLWWRQVFVRV